MLTDYASVTDITTLFIQYLNTLIVSSAVFLFFVHPAISYKHLMLPTTLRVHVSRDTMTSTCPLSILKDYNAAVVSLFNSSVVIADNYAITV
ncbi:hypothetical protein, partial [Escherichia coli]|uniref:hypothetical protein n=1 Tax=Escherichia coli TaxID=562 RepID=UPI001BFEDE09